MWPWTGQSLEPTRNQIAEFPGGTAGVVRDSCSSGLNEEEQEEKRRGDETHDDSLFNDGEDLGRARGV
jgi:hypothetical protein